jgi:hypothetical protein
MKNKPNMLLAAAVILFCLFTFTQNIYLVCRSYSLTEYMEQIPTARAAQASAELCINHPPYFINLPNETCPTNISQGDNVSCKLNASDFNNNTLTFSSAFLTNVTVFNISEDGWINFTTNNSLVGNHSSLITLTDNLHCSNSEVYELYNFTIINVNDPPYLIEDIPDQEWLYSQILSPFYLNDYFDDPDGDNLSYMVAGNNVITVTIRSNSRVILSASNCVKEYVIFTAVDPYGLTENSNLVELNARCPEEEDPGGGGTGSGGGGGGGISMGLCIPDWYCNSFGPCRPNGTMIQECYDRNACNPNDYKRVIEKNCTYIKRACDEDWVCKEWGLCQPNGTQYRECTDQNDCGTEYNKPDTSRACLYDTCNNGIKDPGEEGIDCGGPCPPCPIVQIPGVIETREDFFIFIIALILLVMLILFFAYRLFRKQFHSLFAKILFKLSKKHRKLILLDNNMKNDLLEDLRIWEKDYVLWNEKKKSSLIKKIAEKQKKGKITMQDHLSELVGIIRRFLSLALDMDYEFDKEILQKTLEERNLPRNLNKLFSSLWNNFEELEFNFYVNKAVIDDIHLAVWYQEIKTLIYMFSEINKKEIKQEYPVEQDSRDYEIESLYKLMYNVHAAIHLDSMVHARNIYMNVIEKYEELSFKNKQASYEDVSRLFEEMRYIGETVDFFEK